MKVPSAELVVYPPAFPGDGCDGHLTVFDVQLRTVEVLTFTRPSMRQALVAARAIADAFKMQRVGTTRMWRRYRSMR